MSYVELVDKYFATKDKQYLEQFFVQLVGFYAQEFGLNTEVIFTDEYEGTKVEAGYYSLDNKVIINLAYFANCLNSSEILLRASHFCAHEIRHGIQMKLAFSGPYDINTYLWTLDNILARQNPDYKDPRYINYRLLSYEVDARVFAYECTYNFLNQINPDLAKQYYDMYFEAHQKNLAIYNSPWRASENECGNQMDFTFDSPPINVQELFDKSITVTKEMLEAFPALKLNYQYDEEKQAVVCKENINLENLTTTQTNNLR